MDGLSEMEVHEFKMVLVIICYNSNAYFLFFQFFIYLFFLFDIVQARIVHTKMEPKIESNVIDLKTFQSYSRIKHKISI